jgi:hypothetical protein
MIKRRDFLAATASATALATGGLLGWAYSRSSPEETISDIVYERLPYLTLDAAGVQRFASDFAARRILSSTHLRLVGLLWSLYRRTPSNRWGTALGSDARSDLGSSSSLGLRDRLARAEERIVSTYLISSDFFTHGADQSRTVRYLGCYDALSHACGNPFCRAVEIGRA